MLFHCTSRVIFNAKMHLSSSVAWAVVRSKAVVLLFVDFLFIVAPIVGVCNYTPGTKYIGVYSFCLFCNYVCLFVYLQTFFLLLVLGF